MEDIIMARPIRETPILFGKDAERFTREMKRVESISEERRNAYHEKLRREVEKFEKEWNITYNALREC